MKRRILIALSFALLLTFAAIANAQSGVNQACVADCDKRKQECKDHASGVYITCGQQGGSEATCQEKREKAFEDCIKLKGCDVCYTCADWRMGSLGLPYYCKCGNPYYCGGDEEECSLQFDGGYSNPCDCNPDDPTCTSPILYDLAGNGYHLTNVASGVKFDLRLTGPIQTAWTEAHSDDAFLVLDRNGNGTIDNAAELFGNLTAQPERPGKNGFLALAEFDKEVRGGNGDGLITSVDAVYAELRLWQDKNHNGISELSELTSLKSNGIESTSLDYKETRRRDQYGNWFRYKAGRAWDVFLIHEK